MNSNNTPALIRSLVIYAVCIPLAVWIGYLLAAPADRVTFGYAGVLALIILTPILLRWHHFLLVASWNFTMTIFFLPGSPPVWLLMTAISLGISVLLRAVNSRARFLSAPAITWPLLFFFAVVLGTAHLTGGIGLHSLGGDVSGGKHYFTILFGILFYFALTAQQIPPKWLGFYICAYFLTGCTLAIGDLAGHLPSSMNILFALFPPSGYDMETAPGMMDFHARYNGLGRLGVAGFYFMLARYGVRGVLLGGKPWRWVVFGLFCAAIPFGGFRSFIIGCGLLFAIQFFLEGMHRTVAMPLFIMGGLVAATLIIPFADRLPYTFQRSLAFLPLKLNTAARMDAESSSDWRVEIWRDTYPKVPQYLLLGRGYALSKDQLAMAASRNFKYISTADEVDITGNYHSGPLSVLIPFGAWGTVALLWLWIAGFRVLYDNYRYGDPACRVINTYLFASFVCSIILFLFVFGAIENDVAAFAVLLGFSVSVNGGVRRRMPAPAPMVDKAAATPQVRPHFQPYFQR